MAILNGILKKLNGSAGSLTFKQVNGQTVVSEKATIVKNARTPAQQRQRTKWGNVVQMYKGIMPPEKIMVKVNMPVKKPRNLRFLRASG